MEFKNNKEIYGLEQSNHGHLYRWIFTKESLLKQGIDPHDGDWRDMLFPIGGSNSSATYITKLSTEEEIKNFLLADYNTDYDDPMLVDIAEGILTIDTDDAYYGSITSEFVKHFGIPEDELTKANSLMVQAQSLIAAIKEHDINECSGIDYESPFYGESREMRLSELEEILDKFKKQKAEEQEQWIIGICNTACDGVILLSFYGTEKEIKTKLVNNVQSDRSNDDSYEYGTETVDEVEVRENEAVLYAYGCYSDYHIDYSAKRLRDIVKEPNLHKEISA